MAEQSSYDQYYAYYQQGGDQSYQGYYDAQGNPNYYAYYGQTSDQTTDANSSVNAQENAEKTDGEHQKESEESTEGQILVYEGVDLTVAPKVYKIGNSNKITSNVYLQVSLNRQQKKGAGPIRSEFTHHSSEYNIWYNKKLGDRFSKEDKIKAIARCSANTDAGYTKADLSNKETNICIYFARGLCVNGPDCSYYHRVPTEEDEVKIDLAHDIFGRERHKSYRDDMGGVGSFSRDNRTLYVSGFKRNGTSESTIISHFVEWGELEYVRIVWDKAVAFVKYKLRTSAEFAKEAMQNQSLDDPNEIIDIRWSNEDPNPAAKDKNEKEAFMEIAKKVNEKRRLEALEYQKNQYYQYYYQNGVNMQQYMNSVNQSQGTDYDYSDTLTSNSYPTTDHQYSGQVFDEKKGIEDWLNHIFSNSSKGETEIQKYYEALLSSGFTEFNDLKRMDDIALDGMGIYDTEERSIILDGIVHLDSFIRAYQTNLSKESKNSDEKVESK